MNNKNKQIMDIKAGFNDFCLRELGLSVNEDNYVIINDDEENVLQIKEKFIKYSEDLENSYTNKNEIELNLLDNYRLMEALFQVYIDGYCRANNLNLYGFYQSNIKGTTKGCFTVSYHVGNEIKEIRSDNFTNESVRIFNLVCKLNGRAHLYDFDTIDIDTKKKGSKRR